MLGAVAVNRMVQDRIAGVAEGPAKNEHLLA